MNNTEYVVPEKKLDKNLLLMLIFLGWFGIDKFYYAKSFKKAWKHALVKFAYSLIILGFFWNIWDIIQCCRKNYQFDFREYFR